MLDKELRLLAERVTQNDLSDLSPSQRQEQTEREKAERERSKAECWFENALEWVWNRAGREAA